MKTNQTTMGNEEMQDWFDMNCAVFVHGKTVVRLTGAGKNGRRDGQWQLSDSGAFWVRVACPFPEEQIDRKFSAV